MGEERREAKVPPGTETEGKARGVREGRGGESGRREKLRRREGWCDWGAGRGQWRPPRETGPHPPCSHCTLRVRLSRKRSMW